MRRRPASLRAPQCPDPGWPHQLGLSAMLGTEQPSRCIFACVSAVPFAAEGVLAFLRVGFFGVGVMLCVFACLPFKARLLFRISSAWVGKWHPTTVAGEGVEMLPNSCCFVFPCQKSLEWVWGTTDGCREGWGTEEEGGCGGANCHPPQGTQSASLSACQTFMNIPFVMGESLMNSAQFSREKQPGFNNGLRT